jgi:hypothetical protein
MKFYTLFFLFLSLCFISYSQVHDDDSWLDPGNNGGGSVVPTSGKLRELKPIIIEGYKPGKFEHKYALNYCQLAVSQIENVEMKGKIISISIKGFADGLKNKGIIIDPNVLPINCKISRKITKVDDNGLAKLRACYIESLLQNILKGKPYFTYINYSKDSYDEPDGGKDGDKFRKVEIKITFQIKKP